MRIERVGIAAGLVAAWLSAGCATGFKDDSALSCGEGTVQQGDECVPMDGTGGGSSSSAGSGVASGSCSGAMQRSCFSGPAGTLGVGVCHGGAQSCVGGAWGPCTGEVTPSAEVCNGADDDCNGQVDETCSSIGAGTYETAPGYFDAVLDTERHQVFLRALTGGSTRCAAISASTPPGRPSTPSAATSSWRATCRGWT